MRFRNEEDQKTYDKVAADYKKRFGRDIDEVVSERIKSGEPPYKPSPEFLHDFEEWKKKPKLPPEYIEEEMRRLRDLEKTSREGINYYKGERKKKKSKPKVKKCKCR